MRRNESTEPPDLQLLVCVLFERPGFETLNFCQDILRVGPHLQVHEFIDLVVLDAQFVMP
jgi:hypothetical protein